MDIFWAFLLQLIVVLGAALVMGAIMQRLKQSPMVGYLLAGLMVRPFIENVDLVNSVAQLGVALLMFSIGLEFSVSKLRQMGSKTLLAGAMQISVTTLVIAAVGVLAFGLSISAGVILGMAIAMSSTAVVLPMLQAQSAVDSIHGRFALGILLIQDLAVVPAVLIAAALGGPAEGEEAASAGAVVLSTLLSFGVVGGFALVFMLFTKYVLPILLRFGDAAKSSEMTILFAIVVGAGSAWAANQLGLSAALGAFIAGIFLGESVIATQLRGDIGPLKTIFATLFFSSIGMLAEPAWIWAHLPMVLGITALVSLTKALVVWSVGATMGLTHRHAVAAGVSMGQIGVFSFVIAQVAQDGGVLNNDTFMVVVSVTIVTLFLTPYLTRYALPVGTFVQQQLRKVGLGRSRREDASVDSAAVSGHVVIVGFGPAGRAVHDALHKSDQAVVIIDLNPMTVTEARQQGLAAYVGDAGRGDILRHAQVHNARAVVVTLPDHRAAAAAVRHARALAPNVRVIARARYERYVDDLQAAGAHAVINEEAHVGQQLGISVTEALGAAKAKA